MKKPASVFSLLAETAQFRPVRLFWMLAGAHLLAWTIVPALADSNALVDALEGYAWGHEWPLGTYKHPPLQAWVLEMLAVLTGRAPWAHFFASQVSVVVAFWAVWQTGRRIVDESGALIGALLLVGVVYYNFVSLEFNPNVLQLPFWALMGWSFHRAVRDNHTIDWLALGLWGAAGLYAKYSSVLMLVTLGVLMIAHPDARKRFTGRGPWLAVLTLFLLFLPHVIWLFDHHFMPFVYAGNRFEPLPHGPAFLIGPAFYILGQITVLLPAIFLYGMAFGRSRQASARRFSSFDGMFLHFVTFGPSVLVCMIVVLQGAGVHDMWGTPFWNFAGLWAVYYLRPVFSPAALRRFAYGWSFIFLAGVIGFAIHDAAVPYVTHQSKKIHFPGRILAEQVTDAWTQRYHTPLRYVIGDIWAAGNVAYYAPERPHVLIAGDYEISPWIMPEEIKRYGGVIVWCRGDCTHQDISDVPPWYWTEFKQAPMQPVLTIPQQTGASVPPAKIGWAILPPEGESGP